jgi:hypothetical protein
LVAKFSLAEFGAAKLPVDIETSFEAILQRKKMEPVSPEKTQGKRQSGDDAEVSVPKRPRIAPPGQGDSYSNGGQSFQGFPNAFTPNPHFTPQQQPAAFSNRLHPFNTNNHMRLPHRMDHMPLQADQEIQPVSEDLACVYIAQVVGTCGESHAKNIKHAIRA